MKAPPSHGRSLSPEAQHDDEIERAVELDFVRATEAAALNAMPWPGRGDFETKTIRLRSSQREHRIAEPVSNVPPAET